MKMYKLNDMTRGWFIGRFTPAVLMTDDVEVGIKSYKAGDYESSHFHKIATEVTVILSGFARMGGVEYEAGDIIVVVPYESVDFYALTDVTLAVVKHPGALNDKFDGCSDNA